VTRKALTPIVLPADPAAPMEAATKQYVDAHASAGGPTAALPIGTMMPWGGSGTVPSGWLECDGTKVSRALYPDLFAAIGFSFSPTPGTDPGSNQFYLPDPVRRFIRGVDPTQPVANPVALGGNEGILIASVASRSPNHGHTIPIADISHSHGISTLVTANEGSHTHGSGSLQSNTVLHNFVSNTATGGTADRVNSFAGGAGTTGHQHFVNVGSTGGGTNHKHDIVGGPTDTWAVSGALNHAHGGAVVNSGLGDMPFLSVRYIILAITLVGQKGDKGDKGDQGNPGTPGTNGTNGANGAPGAAGLIVLATGAAIPGGTPAGTVVVRT
jgi:microcystin-dependent protein